MSGFFPRLFGKSQDQGESSRRTMNEMQELKKNQQIAKLESELQTSKAKVEELQGKLEAMKIVLDKKDAALDDITRDREKIALELKNEDLCNKYMKEQLEKGLQNLERDTRRFQIEKSNFQTKKDLILGQIIVKDPEQYPQSLEGCLREIARLQKYTQSLKATLLEREKTIATLCEKFLLLKFKRAQSVAQHKSLKDEFDEISGDLLKKLEDARNAINMLADTKYEDPMDKKNFALVQMVQKNGELTLENSTLKLERSQLKQTVTSLKLENSLIDVTARTFEMTSVPSSNALRTQERSTRESDITNSLNNTYQSSINTESNIPTKSYNSCVSARSAPSSILTHKPKRDKVPPSVKQENDADALKNQPNAAESKECSTKSHKTNKEPRDKQSESRRKRETRHYTSDSSERSLTVSSRSKVTNIPSQLLSELHPSILANDSKDSVKVEKVRRRERPRKKKVKTVRPEEKAPATVDRQNKLAVKEKESVESIYSAYYLSPTRSTPGCVETTAFVHDEKVKKKVVTKRSVQDRPKYIKTKCN